MRSALGMFLWGLDLFLKIALGHLVVFLVWLIVSAVAEVTFGFGWMLAGGIVSLCILGFFEGCDFILLGLAKRVWGDS